MNAIVRTSAFPVVHIADFRCQRCGSAVGVHIVRRQKVAGHVGIRFEPKCTECLVEWNCSSCADPLVVPMFLSSILAFGSAFLWSARRNKWLESGRDPMIGIEAALILPLQGILALDLERNGLMDISAIVYIFGTVGLFWVLHAFANGVDEDSAWRGRTATRIAPALMTLVPGISLLSMWIVAGEVASPAVSVVRGLLWVSCALVSTLLGLSVTVNSARTYWRYNTAIHVCFIVTRIAIASAARPGIYMRAAAE